MINLDSLKSRDITLLTKVCIIKAMVFLVVMHGCESWTIKKGEHQSLKSRDITLLTKVCIIKAMVFLVVMHGCESWTLKKGEHQRIDAFKL